MKNILPVALLFCAVAGAGCDSGDSNGSDKAAATGPVQDTGVRRSAEAEIRRLVLRDMRANATPLDGPPFRVNASCLTQTGSGSNYTLNCAATGYERPKAFRHISGIPMSHRVASERWSAAVQNGKVGSLTRARGRSIGQSMAKNYNLACGDGSSSSGDPACH
jgi:hypothetical protein